MTADLIQRAITRLEELKWASQGDEWYRSIGGISIAGGKFGANPQSLVWVAQGRRYLGQPHLAPADADLIVTLRRTIDAQIDILTLALRQIDAPGFLLSPFYRAALALARAVLGEAADE